MCKKMILDYNALNFIFFIFFVTIKFLFFSKTFLAEGKMDNENLVQKKFPQKSSLSIKFKYIKTL